MLHYKVLNDLRICLLTDDGLYMNND